MQYAFGMQTWEILRADPFRLAADRRFATGSTRCPPAAARPGGDPARAGDIAQPDRIAHWVEHRPDAGRDRPAAVGLAGRARARAGAGGCGVRLAGADLRPWGSRRRSTISGSAGGQGVVFVPGFVG